MSPRQAAAVVTRGLAPLALVSLLTSLAGAGQADPVAAGSLALEVQGLESERGRVLVALFDSAEAWQRESPLASAFLPVRSGRAFWHFRSLPFGDYAIKLFHDANGNGELDLRWTGVPKESYGFSNDAPGSFGPPSFEAARFRLEQTGLPLRIHVR